MPIRYAPPCDHCGSPYLDGNRTTCNRCLFRQDKAKEPARKPSRSHARMRFRCDCGARAVTVIIVSVGRPEDGLSQQRLALCPKCLAIEKEIQAELDRLGFRHC